MCVSNNKHTHSYSMQIKMVYMGLSVIGYMYVICEGFTASSKQMMCLHVRNASDLISVGIK